MTTMTDAAARQMPWDVMGRELAPADRHDVAATLKAAGLDYTVERRNALSGNRLDGPDHADNSRKRSLATDFQALVRPMPDGSERVLGFTKKRYTPIQNGSAFNVADTLVREFGASIIGAADFRGGDRSLLAVDLAEPVTLVRPDGQEDRVDLDLIITNDHAGNAALTFALLPMRFACTNALPAAMRGAERVWKISHTPNAQERINLAEEAILKAATYRDAFQLQAQAMIDQTMVDAEFQKMVAKLYPVKKDAEGRSAENRREVQATLMAAWESSPTIEGIQGTRWAGFNVVTEYLDHARPVRSEAGTARAEGALAGPYVRQKAKLWDMFAAA